MTSARKLEWQRNMRREFAKEHGYSTASHYATNGLRKQVLERDKYRCRMCGMSDAEHKEKWGRPITIDHRDRNRKNNTMANLWTLCLSCHGRKDQLPRLRQAKVPKYRYQILFLRKKGHSYRAIGDQLGLSPTAIWKWDKRWKEEEIINDRAANQL